MSVIAEGQYTFTNSSPTSTLIDEENAVWEMKEVIRGEYSFEKVDCPRMVQVSRGSEFLLLLDTEGQVWGSGSNFYGQLSGGDPETLYGCNKVYGFPQAIKKISAGDNHTLALDIDGQVWGCGSDTSGQLNANSHKIFSPIPIKGAPQAQDIAAGNLFTVILDIDGLPHYFPAIYRQLGEQYTSENSLDIQQIAAYNSSLLMDSKMRLWRLVGNISYKFENGIQQIVCSRLCEIVLDCAGKTWILWNGAPKFEEVANEEPVAEIFLSWGIFVTIHLDDQITVRNLQENSHNIVKTEVNMPFKLLSSRRNVITKSARTA